jgi:hypothetical protein
MSLTPTSLTPMSKETLQALKIKLDTEVRTKRIDALVSQIYTNAVNNAKTSSTSSFQYNISVSGPGPLARMPPARPMPPTIQTPVNTEQKTFCLANMANILAALTPLFPNCSVKHVVFGTGSDSNLYDVTKVPSTVTLNTSIPNQDCIVVDWS